MKSKAIICKARVELLTIRDKRSFFRASAPNAYYVQIWLGNLMVHEALLDNWRDARLKYSEYCGQVQAQAMDIPEWGTRKRRSA